MCAAAGGTTCSPCRPSPLPGLLGAPPVVAVVVLVVVVVVAVVVDDNFCGGGGGGGGGGGVGDDAFEETIPSANVCCNNAL